MSMPRDRDVNPLLQHEGNNRFAALAILLELAFVVPVLAKGPDCHLLESGESEETSKQGVRDSNDRNPRQNPV